MGNKNRNSWLAIIAIALGAFSISLAEFLPVGLLNEISRRFDVSEGTAGITVTSTSILAAIAGPILTLAIGRLDRRVAVLGLSLLLIVSNVLSMITTHFFVLVIARTILGISVGGFWAVAMTAQAKLVQHEKIARATSIVLGGFGIGTVISVPLASYMAAHFDLRIVFAVVCILAIAVFIIQIILLPRIPMEQGVRGKDFLGLLKIKKVITVFVIAILTVSGQFAAYTYITPFFQKVTGIDSNLLSAILLFYGIVSFISNFAAGFIAGRSLKGLLVGTAVIFLISLLGISLFGDNVVISVIAFIIWAIAWGMAPLGLQLLVYSTAGTAIEAMSPVYVGVYQLSVSLGALIGGLVVDTTNVTGAMWLGALSFALVLILLTVTSTINNRSIVSQTE
ncbi:MFS transporter [Paenibacillus sp. BK720]|uniref:MFS transporter n=1 Tax=Paenibacillus sp. BK720 TaxID=2587092 RepID=UPI0014231B6A|nr:MFS transporter [Paenibacillus sp. BK720]NIK71927.1 DHA1 family purine ribonucleoside efflux pump-like MFS transporter [Paenibacillus sp. BK720]